MSAYIIAYGVILLIIAAFFPAMIAADKEYRFSKWYIYSFLLFPVALVHSLLLKRPIHRIRVHLSDSTSPMQRKVRVFTSVPMKKQRRVITVSHICAIFFSKLIFSICVAVALFTLFRTFVHGTKSLRMACFNMALILSVMMSIVEICHLSRFPLIADEITKRSLIFMMFSVACSLPLFLIKKLIPNSIYSEYSDFFTFFFAVTSMTVFLYLILRKQRVYYTFFSRFSDYTFISMIAYAIYAAITLLLLSMSSARTFIHAIAMPMQVLNIHSLSTVNDALNLSYIYSSALAHLVVEIVILFSGLLCRDFKTKELAARIEYRSAAFRMSRKRILRRHIPKLEGVRITPLQNV